MTMKSYDENNASSMEHTGLVMSHGFEMELVVPEGSKPVQVVAVQHT